MRGEEKHGVSFFYLIFSDRKTTIMKRVLGEDHTEISPTVGFNIKSLEFQGFLLNMWDVGGQKSIRSYWRNYFEQTDGIIWVIDSVDRFRLEECKLQLRDILKQEVIFFSSLVEFIIFITFSYSSNSLETGWSKFINFCEQTRPRRSVFSRADNTVLRSI
jgi:signal recognition particle receptor subunit beta